MSGYDIWITNGDISVGDSAADMARSGDLFGVVDGYFRTVGQMGRYSTSAQAILDWYCEAQRRPLEGSFSALVFDQHSNLATLISDRFGTRPLYYVVREGYLHASTRLVNLLNEPDSLTVSSDALSDSMALGFVRAPDTILSGIKRVPRNARVTMDLVQGCEECKRYPDPLINLGPRNGTLEDLKAEVRKALEQECALLAEQYDTAAILLSGGIDSSILAAVASRTFTRCVAYSCEIEGFDNPELERAAYVADQLNLDHKIVTLRNAELPRLFSEMVNLTEGPSRYINSLVTLRIMEEITDADVILGGDGADALFGSVNQRTVSNLNGKHRLLNRLPSLVRRGLLRLSSVSPGRRANRFTRLLNRNIDELVDKVFTIEYADSEEKLASEWGVPPFKGTALCPPASDTPVSRSIEVNFQLFLNSMLMRNSQLASNKAHLHYPFLVDRMIEVSKSVPDRLRFNARGKTKFVLRSLCDDLLGPTVTGWSKIGFVTPEKAWLDNQLSGPVNRLFANQGAVSEVLGWNLSERDRSVLKNSTRMLWWLLTLDEALTGFQLRKQSTMVHPAERNLIAKGQSR